MESLIAHEVGKNGRLSIVCFADYTVIDGEPRTWEYPGSSPWVDFYRFEAVNVTTPTDIIQRNDSNDSWFKNVVEPLAKEVLADAILRNKCY